MFAPTPDPPYTAVIFTSVQSGDDPEGYDRTTAEMRDLAAKQPGYLGIESADDPDTGLAIAVSYWATEDDARAWKRVAEHADAQRQGRRRWYAAYHVRVATVARDYEWESARH